MKETSSDKGLFLDQFKVSKLGDMSQNQFDTALVMIDKKRKKQ